MDERGEPSDAADVFGASGRPVGAPLGRAFTIGAAALGLWGVLHAAAAAAAWGAGLAVGGLFSGPAPRAGGSGLTALDVFVSAPAFMFTLWLGAGLAGWGWRRSGRTAPAAVRTALAVVRVEMALVVFVLFATAMTGLAFMVLDDAPEIVLILGVFIPSLAAASVFWMFVVERRSRASAGLRDARAAFHYVRGVVGGAVLAGALIALAAVLLAIVGVSEGGAPAGDVSRVLSPPFLALFAVATALFLVQGASEEVMFRGWMLGSIARQAGLWPGLIGSSVIFGLFHGDRILISPANGMLVIVGTATVGYAFARWALAERAIYGVCGAHGGFNATLALTGLVGLIATTDAQTPAALIEAFMADFEADLAAVEGAVAPIAQVLVFAALAVLAQRAARRRSL